MHGDPDRGAMNEEESEVEVMDEVESLAIDLDSFSPGGEEEVLVEVVDEEGDRTPPSKVRCWKVTNKTGRKEFTAGVKGAKIAKKWTCGKRRRSMRGKRKKENN